MDDATAPAADRQAPGRRLRDRPGTALLAAGLLAFAVILASYVAYMASHPQNWTLDPVDLGVYQSGGLIVRHVQPLYNPHLAAPLYQWPGTPGGCR